MPDTQLMYILAGLFAELLFIVYGLWFRFMLFDDLKKLIKEALVTFIVEGSVLIVRVIIVFFFDIDLEQVFEKYLFIK